jgi:hypothetical protein
MRTREFKSMLVAGGATRLLFIIPLKLYIPKPTLYT